MKKIIAVPETYLCDECIFNNISEKCYSQGQIIDDRDIYCGSDKIIYKEIDTITESKEYREITEIVTELIKGNMAIYRNGYITLYIHPRKDYISLYSDKSLPVLWYAGWESSDLHSGILISNTYDLAEYEGFIKENMEYMIWQVN